jgi:hypothetical protein
MRVNQAFRPDPGTRPADMVICDDPPPADWKCTWAVHRDPLSGNTYWELKFIHAACLVHGRLRPAA